MYVHVFREKLVLVEGSDTFYIGASFVELLVLVNDSCDLSCHPHYCGVKELNVHLEQLEKIGCYFVSSLFLVIRMYLSYMYVSFSFLS